MTIAEPVRKLGNLLRDLLYPLRCVGCGSGGAALCDACQGSVSLILPPVCPLCGRPQAAPEFCMTCAHRAPAIDGLRSAALFEGVLREAIHCLKYRYMRVMVDPLAHLLVAAWHRYELSADTVVPVPLHPRRVRERGYNQSQLLAERLGAAVGVPVVQGSLRRERYTTSQTRLDARERRQNVAGAFVCTDDRLRGARVLLVDDVCTSRSTLEACCAAAKDGGAKSVWALTVGRAAADWRTAVRTSPGLADPVGAEVPHPKAERREGNASHRSGKERAGH